MDVPGCRYKRQFIDVFGVISYPEQRPGRLFRCLKCPLFRCSMCSERSLRTLNKKPFATALNDELMGCPWRYKQQLIDTYQGSIFQTT
jgi:hypothetical protein